MMNLDAEGIEVKKGMIVDCENPDFPDSRGCVIEGPDENGIVTVDVGGEFPIRRATYETTIVKC